MGGARTGGQGEGAGARGKGEEESFWSGSCFMQGGKEGGVARGSCGEHKRPREEGHARRRNECMEARWKGKSCWAEGEGRVKKSWKLCMSVLPHMRRDFGKVATSAAVGAVTFGVH